MDEALADELRSRPDGAALQAIYENIRTTAPGSDVAEAESEAVRRRETAWARLDARLRDPSRVPFTEDVPPMLSLVTDETPGVFDDAGSAAGALATNTNTNTNTTAAAPPPPRRAARPVWWAVAATLLVAVGGVATWGALPVAQQVVSGEPARMLELPDGSRVWMAAGSRLQYSRRLGWPTVLRPADRAVQLEGEAFFDVQRDGRSFRVLTADATVQVLGTRFSVRAASGTHGSRVQVEEGRVAVAHEGLRVELIAGQGTVVTSTRLVVRDVPLPRVALWRSGGLAALDEPLGEVLSELSRRFGVELEFDDDVDLGAAVSVFYPETPRPEVVLGDLCTAQGLSFERTSRGYRVRAGVRGVVPRP